MPAACPGLSWATSGHRGPSVRLTVWPGCPGTLAASAHCSWPAAPAGDSWGSVLLTQGCSPSKGPASVRAVAGRAAGDGQLVSRAQWGLGLLVLLHWGAPTAPALPYRLCPPLGRLEGTGRARLEQTEISAIDVSH